jgi:ankyrin repeat protein
MDVQAIQTTKYASSPLPRSHSVRPLPLYLAIHVYPPIFRRYFLTEFVVLQLEPRQGFDPYADTVGPGIYGGVVKRDEVGRVVVGRQYQDHNPRPGPVYAGGGYTPMTIALRRGEAALASLLDKYPDLVNEVSTGGATPLHMCGMGRSSEAATAFIVSRGGDIEAEDTYGYRPLHRMASNNLAVGARALLSAGADPNACTAQGETALSIARESRATDVIAVLREYTSSGAR